MMKKLPAFCTKAIIAFAVIHSGFTCAQTSVNLTGDQLEKLASHLTGGLATVQKQVGATDKDFTTFENFYRQQINLDRGKLYADIRGGIVSASNIDEYEKTIVASYTKLYNKFLKIKVEYPSSFREFSKAATFPSTAAINNSCDSGCTNPDFSTGTLYGWSAYYATNSSTSSAFNITGVNGGWAGSVQKAAKDPNTGNTYQVAIMKGGNDPIVNTIPRVSPFSASAYSVRVGDSTIVNYGVGILEKTFHVTSANENFTYQYAIFLQNPGHPYFGQPFFNAVVMDSVGDTIPNCGKYVVISGYQTGGGQGWDSTNYGGKLYYKNWTTVFTSLHKYVGHCVTVRFTACDCYASGHFAYAYVTASCNPAGVITSSPAFCGQKTITLTAPPGGLSYKWTGPTGGIVGSDSSQLATVDSSGTYQVIVSPVTGSACNDTIQINVPKAPGPPPTPSFKADTICAGQRTLFLNTSTPLSGGNVKFYWDFFNTGIYQDSTTNPIWTYNSPGTYTVKLHEINNGCGSDTIMQVKVDSSVITAFSENTACLKQPVNFINSSVGANNYLWTFGDPASGPLDTSITFNATHTFDTAGTYVVRLIAKNGGPCPDTITQTIKVLALPKPAVSGTDSICQGQSTTLTVNPAGTSYTWSGNGTISCASCQATSVTPKDTGLVTYTVSLNNGFCSGDTTYTVYVRPIPKGKITASPDTVCLGDSLLLKATGGCTYKWSNNNATSDSIWIKPTVSTTWYLQVACNGCSSGANKAISVIVPGKDSLVLAKDSICPTDSSSITAFGGESYKWLPPLSSTNSTVTIKANNTTTFSVVVSSQCAKNDTLKVTLHILPPIVVNMSGDTNICIGSSATIHASGGAGVSYKWSTGSTSTSITVTPSTAGVYTYTVHVSNGQCAVDSVFKVRVSPPPTANIIPPPKICPGDSTTICATGGGTYLWSTGQTTSCITVKKGGNYTVYVNKGCIDSAKTTLIVDIPLLDACCDTTMRPGDKHQIYATGQSNYSWSPADGSLSCYTCPNPIASPTVTTTYTVTSVDSAGCPVARTVTIYVEIPCADFIVPNVFTPNDDGRNDDFVLYYYDDKGVMHNGLLNPTSFNINIFDRWGKEVYSSDDATVFWTGHLKNSQVLVPDGVYYYIIKATCGDNNYVKKGFVTVLEEKK